MFELQLKRASFDKETLSHHLFGGKANFDSFRKVLQQFQNDPELRFDPSILHQSRADTMKYYAKRLLRFHQFYPLDGSNELLKANIFTHTVPLSLHALMFIPTLHNLCDKQQEKLFLEPALRGQILGCYAQTELAHGSDVQSLMTTATYDIATESFIINTPEIGAAKWWIGDLGLYCTHAAVYAQLIINQRRYGVHAFVVPIRNPQTMQLLKGVEAGDIGPKNAFNVKDNGYAIFNNLRIPLKNMLMKYHIVSKDGEYSLQGDEKISYATMLITRSNLSKMLANTITKIVTIGTRYSLLRRQFKDGKGEEVQVLNYQTQQQKIIPRIAEAYANWFSSMHVGQLSNFVLQQAKNGRFGRLNQAHIITSGIKAIFSHDVLKGAQIVRRSAGGHGFHQYSGMVAIQTEATPFFTLEGQYTVLLLQVGKFLMKSLGNIQKGKPLVESAKYIEKITGGDFSVPVTEDSLDCPYFIQKILRMHSCGKLSAFSQRFLELSAKKITSEDIFTFHGGLLINDAAVAHCYVLAYSYFLKEFQAATDPKLKTVLRKLLILYGIEKITERAGKFYETSTLTPEGLRLLYRKRESLFAELRPECLALVQAFGYNDVILMSAIAADNQKPYENLIEWAQKYNTVNRKEQRDQIVHAIKNAKSQLKPRL